MIDIPTLFPTLANTYCMGNNKNTTNNNVNYVIQQYWLSQLLIRPTKEQENTNKLPSELRGLRERSMPDKHTQILCVRVWTICIDVKLPFFAGGIAVVYIVNVTRDYIIILYIFFSSCQFVLLVFLHDRCFPHHNLIRRLSKCVCPCPNCTEPAFTSGYIPSLLAWLQ